MDGLNVFRRNGFFGYVEEM